MAKLAPAHHGRGAAFGAGLRRGAVAMLVLVFVILISTLFTASFLVGRAAVGQQELQASADAMARAVALAAQKRGVGPAGRVADVLPLASSNHMNALSGPPAISLATDPTGRFLNVNVRLNSQALSDNAALTDYAAIPLAASAQVQIRQYTIDSVTRNIPKLVLVLDYSGSMGSNFGGGQTRIQALRSAVRDLLDMNLEVQYGLVIYSSDVVDTVAVSDNSVAAIRAAISRSEGGNTCTSCALNRSGSLLRATNEKGRHVLLVSDGYPNNGNGAAGATSASDALRMNDQTTVFSLEIKSAGAGLEQVMRRVAGPKGDPDGNEAGYYFSASNAAALRATFQQIVADILCQAGPIDNPAPQVDAQGRARLFTFLKHRVTGAEILAHTSYEPGSHMLRLTDANECNMILDATHSLVVRYDTPEMRQ